ncbi:MAG: hypothetical protein HRT88_17100, partial [Lentisphaeraceae bacterium]|nr:hypothetical protein [Lentisphaeraceae bacterium]
EAFKVSKLPSLQAVIKGSAAIKSVDLWSNGKKVKSFDIKKSTSEFEFDIQAPGTLQDYQYYYIHMTQVDGNHAWSSPIFIRKK